MDLPPSVVLLYANKLYLFIIYWLVVLSAQVDKRLGLVFGLIFAFGHAQFLTNT